MGKGLQPCRPLVILKVPVSLPAKSAVELTPGPEGMAEATN